MEGVYDMAKTHRRGCIACVLGWNLCSLWERLSQQLPATTCRHKSVFQVCLAPSWKRTVPFEFFSSAAPLPDHTEIEWEVTQRCWESQLLILSRACPE